MNVSTDKSNYYTDQTISNLQWLLNVQLRRTPARVIKWDSFIPLAYSALFDCKDLIQNGVEVGHFSTG